MNKIKLFEIETMMYCLNEILQYILISDYNTLLHHLKLFILRRNCYKYYIAYIVLIYILYYTFHNIA